MSTSPTTNYGWLKPNVGTELNTWGGVCNALFDAVDAQVKAIQNLIPVGTPTGAITQVVIAAIPAGWVAADATTIGNAASNGTGRANADTAALFSALWNQYDNTTCPIRTSAGILTTRGVDAATDFAANKALGVLDLRGYFLRTWDKGRGIDAGRAFGTFQQDAMQNVTGTIGNVMPTSAGGSTYVGTGPFAVDGATSAVYSAAGAAAKSASFDLSRSARTSTETRTKNFAVFTLIKL